VEQRTYVMIKPDAVARGNVGAIVGRLEAVGLKIERMELGMVTPRKQQRTTPSTRASRSMRASSRTSPRVPS